MTSKTRKRTRLITLVFFLLASLFSGCNAGETPDGVTNALEERYKNLPVYLSSKAEYPEQLGADEVWCVAFGSPVRGPTGDTTAAFVQRDGSTWTVFDTSKESSDWEQVGCDF